MTQYLLSLDIGTQGTKGVLFDDQMNAIATAFEASRLVSPAPGTVWQEADEILASCVHVMAGVMKNSNVNPAYVAAIGIDGQMAGIMGIDGSGKAASCYDSWLDSRCGKYMKLMRLQAGRRITEITGGPVTYTHGPKILWWKNEHPETYAKIAKFVLPHAFVVGQLAGLNADQATFDYTHLQYSGFGDNENKIWSSELLETFDVKRDKMARIVSPFDVVGHLTKEFASQTGLLEGTPLVAGAGDTAASLLGAGVYQKNMMLDCAGTASVLCSVVDSFVPDVENETLTMVRAAVDGLWYPLAYINGGGLCLRWFRDEFTGNPHVSYDLLEKEAQMIPAGCEGLTFVPHFDGRVLPNNPFLKGAFVGLNWKHQRGHMFRAVMESIAYEYRCYFEATKRLYANRSFNHLYVMGGAAVSSLFNHIKADVLGVKVTTFAMNDTSLIGSAVIAGTGVGLFENWKDPIQKVSVIGDTINPDHQNNDAYESGYRRYLKTLEAVTAIYTE
ncbi:MAG: FGGY family carbohydrate kinase [Planctomycetia bacterium]|nr:FGGY family carbohydrate kinase [Planctomycetia bacterium]